MKPKKTRNIIQFPTNRIVRTPDELPKQQKKKPGPKPQPIKQFLETLYNDKQLVHRHKKTLTKGLFLAWDENHEFKFYLSNNEVNTADAVYMLECFKTALVHGTLVSNEIIEQVEEEDIIN